MNGNRKSNADKPLSSGRDIIASGSDPSTALSPQTIASKSPSAGKFIALSDISSGQQTPIELKRIFFH